MKFLCLLLLLVCGHAFADWKALWKDVETGRKDDVRTDPKSRGVYGGVGEARHIGGFTHNDTDGQSPALWTWMIQELNVHSLLDVGCGRGLSTKWFYDRGADVLCVEGSRDAVNQTVLPKQFVQLHDYTLRPFVPRKTYDIAWSVEFLEHVGRHYMSNYIDTFKKAAFLFVTHSTWGGYHHVEVHPAWWWKARFSALGFVYLDDLTKIVKKQAQKKDGYRSQHLWTHLLVFVNPPVASLPEHQHLIGGDGCFVDYHKPNRPCAGADQLPNNYLPLY